LLVRLVPDLLFVRLVGWVSCGIRGRRDRLADFRGRLEKILEHEAPPLDTRQDGKNQHAGDRQNRAKNHDHRPQPVDSPFLKEAYHRIQQVGDDTRYDQRNEHWLKEAEDLTRQPNQTDDQ